MKKSLLPFSMIVALAILLCFAISCQEQVEEGITEEDAKAMTDKVLEIWNDGNLALVDEVYAPQIVVRTNSFPEDIIGVEGLKNWVTGTRIAFPDFHMTFNEIIVKGNKIVIRWASTGTQTGALSMPFGELPPTGKTIQVSGMALNRVENEKAVEEIVVFNVLEMLQQLGFTLTLPPPPEPPEEKK